MDQERFDEFAEPDPEAYRRESFKKDSSADFDEEYAAEVAPAPIAPIAPITPITPVTDNRVLRAPEDDRPEVESFRTQEGTETRTGGRTIGWIALVLAIASLFISPVMLGAAAVVLGIIAYIQGSRALGAWSAIIGGISLVAYLVLVPYYT